MATSNTDGQPPAKKLKLSFTDTIQVLVGKEERPFTIHKDIISKRAPFFEAACSVRWLNDSRLVLLPEDDAFLFNIYLSCLYNNDVDIGDTGEEWPNETFNSLDSRTYERLVKSWVLADKLGDVMSANMLMDEYIRSTDERKTLPPAELVGYVARTLPSEAPFHRLFTDYFLFSVNSKTLLSSLSHRSIPRAFLLTLLEEKTALCKGSHHQDTSYDKCRYHIHSEKHPYCGSDCMKIPEELSCEEGS